MLYPVQRLEQALKLWEDVCSSTRQNMFSGYRIREQPECLNTGPISNAPTFRQYLIEDRSSQFDYNRFWGPEMVQPALGQLVSFPLALWSWTRCSRRVFHLTHEIQVLLDYSDLDDMKWEDVHLPFDSFALTLSTPIKNRVGVTYDCILVATGRYPRWVAGGCEYYSALEITLLSTELGAYQGLSKDQQKRMAKAVRARNWDRARSICQTVDTGLKAPHIQNIRLHLPHQPGALVLGRLREFWQRFLDTHFQDLEVAYEAAMRLIAGLALYFQTLPSSDIRARHEWMPVPGTVGVPNKAAITAQAHVCTVTNYHELSEVERVLFGIDGCDERTRRQYELCYHKRRGYWRRPPGLGSDPTAEKTVWVRPAAVRKDKAPLEGLEGGGITAL